MMMQTWKIRGGGDGQGRELRPADGIRRRADHGRHSRPSGNHIRNNTKSLIEAHREHILQHISSNRVTFIQGETGSGKSTAVPQFILDDATARGQRDRVRVIVAQPRRVAAVSLAQYVAQSRGERVGMDVGYAVAHERASTLGMTRLTFVTSGYLLEWLARNQEAGRMISHIILDEVHVRSVEQDLLLLLLKLLLAGMGNTGRWLSLHATKLIIMSATMEVRPLQEYFSCLQQTAQDQNVDPITIRGSTFPVEIVYMDKILDYLPGLSPKVAYLATRFLEAKGTCARALYGTNLPHFAIDLVTGLVMHVGQAGESILVFVATFSDILEIQQGFERASRSRDATLPPLDVMCLHSMLSREDQEAAIAPVRPGTLKVIIATNVAESSLTVPNVRVVFDLGHQLQVEYGKNLGGTMSRVWCSKASARQRAGRVGRLFPGVVIRLYTREIFENLPAHEKPDIALQNLGPNILRVKSLFQSRFPNFSVVELLQQLLDSPNPGEVSVSIRELKTLGAITKTSSSEFCELTLLGRLAAELSPDVHLARFVLLGVATGCAVDCVIIAAGISLRDDIFNQPFLVNRTSMDPILLQERRIASLRARLHFYGGHASNLLVYCQVYHEWVKSNMQSTTKQWIKRNELKQSTLDYFLLLVREYAQKTIAFVTREFGHCMEDELSKLRTLAAVDPRPGTYRRGETIPKFCDNIAVVQMAIAGGFSENWLIGVPAKDLQSVAETRELEESSMPAHLSFKLKNVPPNFSGPDILKLEMALKVLGPIHRVVPSGQRAVLVQCELQREPMTSLTSAPVVLDLPDMARLASYMAKSCFPKGELIISRTENLSASAKLEEIFLGRPSSSRQIKWQVEMGKDVRGVRFNRLNPIARSVEVRKGISFHIAVAVNLFYTPDTSDVLASNVTVLPQDNLFSVMILLMFRPSGPEGEIQVRLLSKSDRIYSIKYQGLTLDLGPRFICMPAFGYIDGLRTKIQEFLAGAEIENCNLARDMVHLHQYIQATEYGAPLLAPELGLWLAYPSLIPVKQATKEDKTKLDDFHNQLKLCSHQQSKGSASTIQDTQSCPVLLQSRNDKCASRPQANYELSAHVNLSKLPDLQLFEQAFEAAELEVDRTQLIEWIGGNKSHNGICFELLKRLVKNSGHMEDTKVVLQYVHSRLNELVNKKQKKELEGLYHSICNSHLAGNMPTNSFGAKAAQRVKVQTNKSQVQCQLVKSIEINEDSMITRQVAVKRQQIESIISALQYQYFAARIQIGSFSSSQRPVLVTVSGKGRDVEQALQGIETMINSKHHSPPWRIDDTYIESINMDQKVRCVPANGFQYNSSDATGNKSLEFMLVRDKRGEISQDNSYARDASSLFNARMKVNFEEAMKGLGPGNNVQIQARLGRVVFACSSVFKERLPFLDGQVKQLGELTRYLDRHQISKRRFDDTIPDEEFYYLRAGLHLSHPKTVERYNSSIIVVSNPTARDERDREGKFKIVDAIHAPGRFRLQGVERRTKLAVADVVRLNTGATQVDVRLSMQENEEDHEINEEARVYVSKIRRKGSKLEFPSEPYTVRVQRHKDCEIFWFDGLKVSLVNVMQIRGGILNRKNEVEFEAIGSRSEVGQAQMAVPLSELTSKIHVILKQVQSVCSQLSLTGPSCSSAGVVQALLRSWKIDHDEILLKSILIREFLPVPSKGKVVGVDQEQVSMQICSLVEVLCHRDSRTLKDGIDVAAELQLVLLHIIQSMNISVSKSMEGRVKWLLANHKLEPENALQYASLVKCFCSPLDGAWHSVLQPYVLQLILENQSDILEKFYSRVNLGNEFSDYSSVQLRDSIMQSSVWTTLSALRRVFQSENISVLFKILNVVMTYQETIGPSASLVRCFVRDLLGFCGSKAASFVGKCLEWTVEKQSSIVDWKTHMQTVFRLLEIIKMLNINIDEHCRSKILDLLLRLPSSMDRKSDLEEALLDTYGVDETQFRNLHYQRILQQLGHLQDTHRKELKRRGLDEKRCSDFNFQSWIPGKVRGKDIMGSSLIPGLNARGTRLLGSRGIFIPARDPLGQITGGQIKVDDNSTGKRKYIWLSSNKQFNGGKGPQIAGELPLFCCIPRESDLSIVGLCEGGLKAHVLAALSGLPVIGASGADFPRSENLLQSYLVMMDVEQIIFFPDAGSQCNDQVTSCYFQTFRLLRDWGYNVLVAWWGQINKTEHDDIDDYLVKHTYATELPLFSTFQFWKFVSLDVRESLQSKLPEYKTPQVSDVVTGTAQETFTDDDQIKIVEVMETGGSSTFYQIKIPKEVMKNMPRAPDDYGTPQSVKIFTIEVRMVQMDDPVGVEAAIDWLLSESDASRIVGLDCEHGFSGDLNLIQVSTHQRCVLLRLTRKSLNCPSRFVSLLREKKVVKSGAEVHNDALAIYNTLGLMVNGLKNISAAYKTRNRTAGMLEIFRNLYGWEWTKKKAITRSDWGCANLTLEQIKYAALDAWASRMIALEGPAALDTTVTSLENLPEELLKLFARAISNYGILKRTEKTVFETSGSISESSRSTLRLLQHDFRSRVTSTRSQVELRFNNGQEPAFFQAKTRTGKSVVLSPLSNAQSSAKIRALPIDISSISNVIVDNSKSFNPQFQRLREVFYDLLCHPDRCSGLLSLALKCGLGNTSQNQECERSIILKKPECEAPKFTTASPSKNSQHGKAKIPKKPELASPTCTTASSSQDPKHGKAKIPKKQDLAAPTCTTASTSKDPQDGKAKTLQKQDLAAPTCTTASTSKGPQHGKAKIPKKPECVGPEFTKASTSKNPQHGKGKIPKKSERAGSQFTKASTSKNPQHGNAKVPSKQVHSAFPKEASQLTSKQFEEVFTSVNDSQREALLQILTSPLSATIGPPGTGKTRLITAVAKAWLHARGEREVLICTAYQNVAARNLAEALIEEQVPGVLLLLSEDYFVDWHETFYEQLANSVVVTKTKCEIPGALEDWRTRNKRGSVPILVCTLGLVGSPAFMTSLMGGKVTAMVIDECSQAAEGDCIYPLTCLPDLSLLTVLGDPYQLPPFSGSGSGSIKVPSIFDLVSNGCEVKLLREQYRMPPTICSFISSEIYQNELKTAPNRRNEKDWHRPLLWVNVQGVSTKDPGKTSMYNTAEAQAILQLCQKLNKCYAGNGVVVLTLYEEQNRRISKLLEAENLHERVTVHNVDSFQGQQSDIVLISLVAGKYFSPFAADPHRACVMLTRVKRFLCVCGNYDAVRHNPHDLLWKSLATFCGAHGLVASLKDAESRFAILQGLDEVGFLP